MSSQAPKRRENRKLKILETALSLISEQGVDAITHRKVAAVAGIPLGSTTYYFESREHLIRAAFDYYLEWIKEMSPAAVSTSSDASGEDLVDFLVAFSRREFERPELARAEYAMTLFATRDELLAESINAWYEDMVLSPNE